MIYCAQSSYSMIRPPRKTHFIEKYSSLQLFSKNIHQRMRIQQKIFFQRWYKVKISKWEFCKSDCRFMILAKNCHKKVLFFFWYSFGKIVKIEVKDLNKVNFKQKSNFDPIYIFDLDFNYVPEGISIKEEHFLLTVFCKDYESAIRFIKFSFWNFDLISPLA